MILAIDPGTTQSAWVQYENGKVHLARIYPNETLVWRIADGEFAECEKLYIEMIASYGMPVGQTVFETCAWVGRFTQAWLMQTDTRLEDSSVEYIYRKDVKMHLCGTPRAKDTNIRQAIMDLYGSTREAAIGTKKNPQALYGVSKDMWAALGVAITAEGRK